jgi:hypothetical protein
VKGRVGERVWEKESDIGDKKKKKNRVRGGGYVRERERENERG